MRIKTKNGYYLKNIDLIREISDFKQEGVASETLGRYLLLIASNLSTKGNFHGYTWRTDMVSEAVLTCIQYLRNYDTSKSNAFAYVTQICRNAMIAYIKKEHKHSQIKDRCYKLHDDLVVISSEDENGVPQPNENHAINYQVIGEKRRKRTVKNKR